MGTGFLQVVTSTGAGALPIPNAKITILGENGDTLYQLTTNESGAAETVALEAPDVALTLDAAYTGVPYSVCDVKAEAPGFSTMVIHGVEILDTETSILPIDMMPSLEAGNVIEMYTPPHNLVSGATRAVEGPPETGGQAAGEAPIGIAPFVLNEVIIPEFVTVHLGRPDNP
ncbi:MAG: carboxypeptidase-like regulatory domain-containing protein, partial [Defluviitaleaceae bacterium]|nr:carboxypeptidase-like regulatory domain-containing protein [Defluviitaleaceae bacterium]